MSILDCNFPAIIKGLELMKEIDKIIDDNPEYKKIVGNIKLYVNDDQDGMFRIGHWEYFDYGSFEFYEST